MPQRILRNGRPGNILTKLHDLLLYLVPVLAKFSSPLNLRSFALPPFLG
jgi:hypothetical protein